jgi:uncharacterized RDD family membrane protein YckC
MSSHQPNPLPRDLSSLERHVIETPEQIDLHFQIAGIGSRFLAIALDTVIQGVLGVVFGLGLLFLTTSLSGFYPRATLWIMAGFIVFVFLLYFAYFALFEIFWNGQTPGKRLVGIRVLKESGRPLNALEVSGRNLLRIVDQLPGFYAVAIIVAMLNRQSKRLGDFVAGSIVVRESALVQSSASWNSRASAVRSVPLGANLLTAEDAGLIEAFLVRRHDLAPGVRDRMARAVLKRIREKIPSLGDLREAPEALLVSLLDEYRSNGLL